MFVLVATGLAVLGGAVYSVLNRDPDRLSAALLFVSGVLLVGVLLVALAHLVSV